MKSCPLVSIVLPTFNTKINELNKSLDSLSTQTYGNYECLIIDDSTDNFTIDFLQCYAINNKRFFYIRGDGRGIGSALNKACNLSKGKYILRADDTDVNDSSRLFKQVTFMESNPNVDILGSNITYKTPEGKFNSNYKENHWLMAFQLVYKSPLAHPSVIFRKEIIDFGFNYDKNLKQGEDLDFWIKLFINGYRFANLNSILVEYDSASFQRSFRHHKSNSIIRLKYSYHPIILISFFVSLLHFIIPKRLKHYLYLLINIK